MVVPDVGARIDAILAEVAFTDWRESIPGDRAVKKLLRGSPEAVRCACQVEIRNGRSDHGVGRTPISERGHYQSDRRACQQNRFGPSLGFEGSDTGRDESRCLKGSFGRYRRTYSHTIAIMTPTNDEAPAERVRRITKAADEELEAFEAAISVSESGVNEDRRLVAQLRDMIQTAMLELVDYGLLNLRVAD